MKKNRLTRRKFISSTSAGAAGAMLSAPLFTRARPGSSSGLALRGGDPVRTGDWPPWPVWNPKADTPMLSLLKSGDWYRGDGNQCNEFERAYAELIGARRVIATASGSTALVTSLHTIGVDAGDEVIVSPFTFIATYNVVFNQKALPVFADTDPETFTINPDKIEERITDDFGAHALGHSASIAHATRMLTAPVATPRLKCSDCTTRNPRSTS